MCFMHSYRFSFHWSVNVAHRVRLRIGQFMLQILHFLSRYVVCVCICGAGVKFSDVFPCINLYVKSTMTFI